MARTRITTIQLSNPVKFSVYRSAALNSANTPTVVAFDAKTYDTSSNVDVVTNKGRFTAPVAGFYRFNGMAGNTAALNTQMIIGLYKNGLIAKWGMSGDPSQVAGGLNSYLVFGSIQLAAGDYVEVVFVGGSGSVMAVGATQCYFDGELISIT